MHNLRRTDVKRRNFYTEISLTRGIPSPVITTMCTNMPSAMQIPAPPFLDKPQASYGVLIDDLELYHAIFQTWCIVPKLLYIVNMKSCAGLSNGVISNDLE